MIFQPQETAYPIIISVHLGSVHLKIEGGLGNQLFELAAGYYLAAKLDMNLKIDQYSIPLSTAHGEKKNGFEEFSIDFNSKERKIDVSGKLPSPFTIKLAQSSPTLKRIFIKKHKILSNNRFIRNFYEERSEDSALKILQIEKPMNLYGNFQSWAIVEEAAKLGFPRILQLRKIPYWMNKVEHKIDIKKSLVMHFRVGRDAIHNENFRQPSVAYYERALALIDQSKKFKEVFILTDSFANLQLMYPKIVKLNLQVIEMPSQASPAERLFFLSQFGGIICANSTFCGWAAWSIYNSGGEVIVPVPYSDSYVPGSRHFPSSWIRLCKNTGIELSDC